MQRPVRRRSGNSLEYERELSGGVHFLARATLEDNGVLFHYEFLNRSSKDYDMIYAVTDPRLTRSPNKTCGRECKKGYQLETDSLGGDPILRRLKDNEVIRPMSANRNTIKAIEKRGLIRPGKGRGPLTIVWRLKNQGI